LVKRYIAAGFDGLGDRPRSGRPPEIEHHVWQKLATVVVQAPEKFGWALARWLVRAQAEFLARRFGWDVSRSSISCFLRSMALKPPHRVRYWLNPSDPDFDAKAAKICKLYISPPAGTTVLYVDEKPGVRRFAGRELLGRCDADDRSASNLSTTATARATSLPPSTFATAEYCSG
jgi:hypothetical protein